jgi:1,5-anhydro-D-fructose reductase (1,5-anhydro-D-mannitol-forming)
MVHYFHVLRYLLGEVESVSALTTVVEPVRTTRDSQGVLVEEVRCEVDDTISCSLRFAGGAVGNLFFTWAGRGQSDNFPGSFHGTRGCFDGGNVTLDGHEPVELGNFFEANATAEDRASLFPHGIRNAFSLEILDFLQAIREGREMVTSAAEGTRDLAVSFAALESSLAGRRVAVRDVYEGRLGAYEEAINSELKI